MSFFYRLIQKVFVLVGYNDSSSDFKEAIIVIDIISNNEKEVENIIAAASFCCTKVDKVKKHMKNVKIKKGKIIEFKSTLAGKYVCVFKKYYLMKGEFIMPPYKEEMLNGKEVIITSFGRYVTHDGNTFDEGKIKGNHRVKQFRCNNQILTIRLSNLVWNAFHINDRINTLKDLTQFINHKDGNTMNIHLSNLEKKNINDLPYKKDASKVLVENIDKTLYIFNSLAIASKVLDISKDMIKYCSLTGEKIDGKRFYFDVKMPQNLQKVRLIDKLTGTVIILQNYMCAAVMFELQPNIIHKLCKYRQEYNNYTFEYVS